VANPKNLAAAEEARDFGRAVRTLLRRPLLTARADMDAFALVRRHRRQAGDWFAYYCGWRLEIDSRAGYARLFKAVEPRSDRPFRRPRGSLAPFDRRRYVLMCVIASELLHHPVTVIGRLADDVARACADDAALPDFDSSVRAERSAFVDAVLTLVKLGAIEELDGSADRFAADAAEKVLLRTHQAVLLGMLASPTAPSRLDGLDLAELVRDRRFDAEAPASDDDRSRRLFTEVLRRRLCRRLAEEPVVYLTDLSAAEIDYARSLTGRANLAKAAELAGMVYEERRDGLMWIDTDKIATDLSFPESGTVKQAALFVLEALQSGVTEREALMRTMTERLDANPKWAKQYRSDGGASRLCEEALGVLVDCGLARNDGGAVMPLPAAWRYRIDETLTRGGARGE
jgi:uncharacterized protein (TIGR02678 family)